MKTSKATKTRQATKTSGHFRIRVIPPTARDKRHAALREKLFVRANKLGEVESQFMFGLITSVTHGERVKDEDFALAAAYVAALEKKGATIADAIRENRALTVSMAVKRVKKGGPKRLRLIQTVHAAMKEFVEISREILDRGAPRRRGPGVRRARRSAK